MSGWLKGCAGLVLFGVFLFSASWFWLSRPGSQRPTVAVVSERSAGAVRFAPPEDDPGVEALRQALRIEIEAALERAPAPFRSLLSEIADRFVPNELTLSLEAPAEGEAPLRLVAFNPKGYTRLLRFLVSLLEDGQGEEFSSTDYRGASVYRLDDGSHVAFLGGTGLISESERALLGGIDRLRDGGGEAGRRMLEVRLAPPPGGWDLIGAFPDGALLARQIRGEDGPETGRLADALEDAGPVVFAADFETADRLTGRLRVETGSSAAAARLARALRRSFAIGGGLDATLTTATRGTRVEAELVAVAVADSLFGPP